MADTITLDQAGEIDARWMNAGMPDDGLRIYGLRRSGNRTMTFLGVPKASKLYPTYVLSNGKYLHLCGPTLSDWQAMQDARRDSQDARELYEYASGR